MLLSLKAYLFLLLSSRHLCAGCSATKTRFLQVINFSSICKSTNKEMACSSTGIEADDSSILCAIPSFPDAKSSSPSNFSPGKTESEASLSTDHEQIVDSGNTPPAKIQRPRRIRPNAFISIRIPSVEIKQGLEHVQDGLVKYDRDMRHVLTSLEKLHITLTVFNLSDDADIERAKTTLDKVTKRLIEHHNVSSDPVTLSFKGLGAFGREVLFAKVDEGPSKDRLTEIVGIVRSEFTSELFEGIDSRSFKPHVTIAKMSKMPRGIVQRYKRQTRKRKGIDQESYSVWQDVEFGSQVIEGLELLSMDRPSDEQGYYHCFQRNQF